MDDPERVARENAGVLDQVALLRKLKNGDRVVVIVEQLHQAITSARCVETLHFLQKRPQRAPPYRLLLRLLP
jgi:predicted proteasome-type protease